MMGDTIVHKEGHQGCALAPGQSAHPAGGRGVFPDAVGEIGSDGHSKTQRCFCAMVLCPRPTDTLTLLAATPAGGGHLKHRSGGSSGLQCGRTGGSIEKGEDGWGVDECFSFSMCSSRRQSFVSLAAVKCSHACLSISIIRVEV